ncbi:YggT family protein [Streptococcus suis]|uniref:YggT family protein n=2 Tax=Streptococcus iners TaxID=3028084 RepID=A0AA96VUM9_9STRE|nr:MULTISPECIES: YggT family protein [Streptococcus]MCK3941726.1 YggT family protein [Streptococcus suis]MCK4025796.1 YggT family protein [Streptococcus suis]MCK4028780.1 YggT family protein [Streptococcus suis]NQJ71206.1 YggT family protein [Streptococcus suis]WNY48614.1 YggT family protein [Streptococcus sp. 29892]
MQILILILLKFVEIYSYLLFAYALLSWFPALFTSPLGRFLESLVSPLLKPFRRLNLQFMGLDLTVLVAMLVLNMGTRLLVQLLVGLV